MRFSISNKVPTDAPTAAPSSILSNRLHYTSSNKGMHKWKLLSHQMQVCAPMGLCFRKETARVPGNADCSSSKQALSSRDGTHASGSKEDVALTSSGLLVGKRGWRWESLSSLHAINSADLHLNHIKNRHLLSGSRRFSIYHILTSYVHCTWRWGVKWASFLISRGLRISQHPTCSYYPICTKTGSQLSSKTCVDGCAVVITTKTIFKGR